MIVEGLALSAMLAFAAPSSTAPAHVPLSPERQAMLEEMRERRIVPPDAEIIAPRDEVLLDRVRQAEASGAVEYLESNLGALRGLTVRHRAGVERDRRLTKAGYEKYLFLRSQQARAYFESQDTDARIVFQIRDMQGEDIFDPDGLLTPAGENLYSRILRGETVRWIGPSGQAMENTLVRPAPDHK